jgi:HK97 gp10 family phage protein
MYQTFHIAPTEDVGLRLLELSQELQTKVVNQAMKKANEYIEQQYRYYVPNYTGALSRSINTKIKKYQDGRFTVGIAGVDMAYTEMIFPKKGIGQPRTVRPAKYIHLIEGGTVKRQNKKGQNRGQVTPRPFMHEIQQNVINQVREILDNEVIKAIQKYT